MEISYYKGLKYSTKCPDCYGVIKFKINTKDFNISGECMNNHKFINMPIKEFENCIKKTNSSYTKCNRCYYLFNNQSNSFLCENCNQIFCNNCINIHSKAKKHLIRSNYIKKYKQCKLHNRQYTYFCENCKINLCDKCKEAHLYPNHIIKSFTDILPSIKEIESNNEVTNKYNEKINKIIKEIEICKNDVLERYNKITGFLNFLNNNINEKLLKQFNFSFFDYYNYENFKYCNNFINKDIFLQNNNYINYLINGKNADENKSDNNNKDKIDKEIVENKEIYNIKYFSSLIYYKDNFFMDIGGLKNIILYEFTKHSFKYITEYKLTDLGDVHSIKVAKYNNDILINFDKKKNIKILKYNSEDKTFSLSKNDIKAKKSINDKKFIDYIEDNDNRIITTDSTGISIWKKHKKQLYVKTKIINGIYSNLFNVTENIICAQSQIYSINFFKDNLQLIENTNINEPFTYIDVMKDKFLCVKKESNNNLLFIDLKYFEIVQIISNKTNFNVIKFKDNNLFELYLENFVLKVHKSTFDYKKGCFEEKQIIEKNINYTSDNNYNYNDSFKILITDNNYFIVSNCSELYVFDFDQIYI